MTESPDILEMCMRALLVSVSALATSVAALVAAKRNGRGPRR